MAFAATAPSAEFEAIRAEVDRAAGRTRRRVIFGIVVVALYLAYSFFQLGLDKAAESWNPQRASFFLLDLYAHKDHVTRRQSRPDEIRIALEGDYRAVYTEPPAWYALDKATDGARVSFNGGGTMVIYPERATI
ncbi:MAG: hypothetical protein AAFO70_04950, partial [Pseudomonadota bacterium]